MSSLWLITTYFNPLHWSSRRRNYDIFRRHLDANLLTVEWSPSGQFQLTDRDADRLIQISGGDLMWQKERLINIGLSHLPDDCEFAGWVDCDIVFRNPQWINNIKKCLETEHVAQLYSVVEHLDAAASAEPFSAATTQPSTNLHSSLLWSWLNAAHPGAFLDKELQVRGNHLSLKKLGASTFRSAQPGLAWAARRDWLTAIGGLPDTCITGGGDTQFAFCLLGRLNDYVGMLERSGLMNYYCPPSTYRWNEKVEASRVRISCIEGTIAHLYHGESADRQYEKRHHNLARTGFRPDQHLDLAPGGAWRFNDAAPPGVHDLMASYFASRREDGAPTPA